MEGEEGLTELCQRLVGLLEEVVAEEDEGWRWMRKTLQALDQQSSPGVLQEHRRSNGRRTDSSGASG